MRTDDGTPIILFIAVCSECGATGVVNQIGGTTGQHSPVCPWYPATVSNEGDRTEAPS